jgi:large repetitive protein
MLLSSLYKSKGAGLILRLAGVLVLLFSVCSYVLTSQPAAASTSSLVTTLSVDTDIAYNGSTIQYTVFLIDLNRGQPQPADFDVFFAPPGADGNPGTEVQLNIPGVPIHLNVGESIIYDNINPANYPPQNRSSLTQTLALNNNVISALAQDRFSGTYANGDTATGSQTVHTDVIWPRTAVTIASNPVGPILSGSTVTLTVTETNNTVGPNNSNLLNGIDITSPSVTLTDNHGSPSIILNKASPYYSIGDGDRIGVLDGSDTGTPLPSPGADNETWIWVIPNVVLNSDTTFTVNGDGIDKLNNHVNFDTVGGKTPGIATERAQTTVSVFHPNTEVTIHSSAPTILTGGTVNLTVTEHNTGDVPLTNPKVNVAPLVGDLIAPPTSGDTNSNSILDIGETWSWTVNNIGPLTATTTFTALGDGIDPLGNHITFANGYQGEKAQVEVIVIHPNTVVSIHSSVPTVLTGGTVTLTVTEHNTGDVALTSPKVNVAPLVGDLIAPPTSGDTNSNGILNVGETWSWTVNNVGPLTATTTFTALGDGIDPLGNHITFANDYIQEKSTVGVTVIHPNTVVTINTSAPTILTGGTVTLTVTEHNTGDVPLTSPKVNVSPLVGDLIAPPTSGDTNSNSILDVGETWSWTINNVGPLTTTTTFTALGDGIDPLGNHITFENGYQGEKAQVEVVVIHPNTAVSISSSATTVLTGGTVTLTVTEHNTGDVALTSPKVNVEPIVGDLIAPPTSGDTNSNNILDIGETWSWTVNNVGPLTITTIFTATGHGLDPIGTDITFPRYQYERDYVSVIVIHPNTQVDIKVCPNTIYSGDTICLTITEINNGDVPIMSPSVTISSNPGTEPLPLTFNKGSNNFVSGDTNDNGILDVSEAWTWKVCQIEVTETTSFTALGDGFDQMEHRINFENGYAGEKATVEVTVINPNTTVTITSSENTALTIESGNSVTLTVTESNTGDVPLTNAYVVLSGGINKTLNNESAGFSSNLNTDSTLDVGEIWTWSLSSGPLTSNTVIFAIGHGIDPLAKDITFPCYPNERAYISITIIKPTSRTDITASDTVVKAGEKVILVVAVQNPGEVPLTNIGVNVSPTVGDLTTAPTGGDNNNPGTLDVGETWWWIIPDVQVNTTTTFIAVSHGTDPLGNDVTSSDYWIVVVSENVNVIPGDANGNGVVETGDVTEVLRIITGLDPITPGADANQDGKIDMADVITILKIIKSNQS